MDKAYSISVHL